MRRKIFAAAAAALLMAVPSVAAGGDDGCRNQVVDCIMSRRSVRKYELRQVEREKLDTIVMCGINAPSGMNRQPWQVRVVTSADFIDGITEAYRKARPEAVARDKNFKNLFRGAPAIIAVATPADGSSREDSGMMAQNMMLSACSLGLGTCCLEGPVGFINEDPSARPYLERLNIPEGYKLLYIIAVGYPDESPEGRGRDASKVEFID